MATPDVSLRDLWHEIMQFYIHEAWLLDDRQFRDWLELFTDDVLYFMPRRRNVRRKDLDQAAQSILRLASPFDPFPADLRKQYDELRFAYEWQFLNGSVGAGTVSVPSSAVKPAQ